MSIILVVSFMLAASPSSQKITEKCIDTSGMRTPGVLSLIEHPVRDGKDTIDVFDTQKRVIARIYSNPSDGFVIAFVQGNHRSLTIRVYDPEYGILIFDSFEKQAGRYKVFIDGKVAYIQHRAGVTQYESWPEHIRKAPHITTAKNPLRIAPRETSRIVAGHNQVEVYSCTEVRGDWARLKSDPQFDPGNSSGKTLEGWVQWRKGTRLLAKIVYSD